MTNKNFLTILFMFLLGIAHGQIISTSTNPEHTVSVKKAQKMAKHKVLLVDLRTPEEFAEKEFDVKNSINIPIEKFESSLANIPTDQKIILACRTGNKSKKAYAILEKKGYKNMVHMDGGIVAWYEAGLPTKEGKKGCCSSASAGDCKKDAAVSADPKAKACCSKVQ